MNTEPIDVHRMFELLVEACPDARQEWDEHCRAYVEEDPCNYIGVAVFARYVVACARLGQLEKARVAFDLVEQFIVRGSPYVRDLATIGFLEDLQTIASWEPFGYAVFVPLLKPHSRRAWDKIEAMWEGKSSLMDVLRVEAEAAKKR